MIKLLIWIVINFFVLSNGICENIITDENLRGLAFRLNNCAFISQENVLLKKQVTLWKTVSSNYQEAMDKQQEKWYDNWIFGFFLGFVFTGVSVWGAGQLK